MAKEKQEETSLNQEPNQSADPAVANPPKLTFSLRMVLMLLLFAVIFGLAAGYFCGKVWLQKTMKLSPVPPVAIQDNGSAKDQVPSGVPDTINPSLGSESYDLIFYTFPVGKPENKTYWKVGVDGSNLQEYRDKLPADSGAPLFGDSMKVSEKFRKAINYSQEEGSISIGVLAEDKRHGIITTNDWHSEEEETVWSYDVVDGSTREIMKLKVGGEYCSQIIGWSYSNREIYAVASNVLGSGSGSPEYLKEICVYNDRTGEKVRGIDVAPYQYNWSNYQVDPKDGLFVSSGYGSTLDDGRTILVNLRSGEAKEILDQEYLLSPGWRMQTDTLAEIVVVKIELTKTEFHEFKIYSLGDQSFSEPIIFERVAGESSAPRPVEFLPNRTHLIFEHLVFKDGRGSYCWYSVRKGGGEVKTIFCDEQVSSTEVGSGFLNWIRE